MHPTINKRLEALSAKKRQRESLDAEIGKEEQQIIKDAAKFSENWNGRELKGIVSELDSANWNFKVQTGTYSYVMISVDALRESHPSVAYQIADLITHQRIPGIGSRVLVHEDGLIETLPNEYLQKPDGGFEVVKFPKGAA